MKFKIGDKVRIKLGEKYKGESFYYYHHGKIGTIKDTFIETNALYPYKIEIEKNGLLNKFKEEELESIYIDNPNSNIKVRI